MKTPSARSLLVIGLSLLAFTATGRAEQSPAVTAPRTDVAPPPPAPTTAEIVTKLKTYTYEQRAEYALLVDDLTRKADAALTELSASYVEVKSSPTRRKAMEAYRAAAADFKDKATKVDNAQPENWESITSNLATSWQNLQGAEAKFRSEKA